jgi:hypothetical protein
VHVFDPVRRQLEIGGVAGTKVVEEKKSSAG